MQVSSSRNSRDRTDRRTDATDGHMREVCVRVQRKRMMNLGPAGGTDRVGDGMQPDAVRTGHI